MNLAEQAFARQTAIREALTAILSRVDDHPGISDLDDEQPMHVMVTLGEVRKWRRLL